VQRWWKVSQRHGKGLIPAPTVLNHEAQGELIGIIPEVRRSWIDSKEISEDSKTGVALASATASFGAVQERHFLHWNGGFNMEWVAAVHVQETDFFWV
jgi:hypothetical protein